jgi:hypothetical protein
MNSKGYSYIYYISRQGTTYSSRLDIYRSTCRSVMLTQTGFVRCLAGHQSSLNNRLPVFGIFYHDTNFEALACQGMSEKACVAVLIEL